VKAQVAGRAVLLIPHRGDDPDETGLPDDYRKILAIVRAADGPVQVRTVGEELGLEVAVRGKLEPLRAKMTPVRRPAEGGVRHISHISGSPELLCPGPWQHACRHGKTDGNCGWPWRMRWIWWCA
jgi:hypothetical protein